MVEQIEYDEFSSFLTLALPVSVVDSECPVVCWLLNHWGRGLVGKVRICSQHWLHSPHHHQQIIYSVLPVLLTWHQERMMLSTLGPWSNGRCRSQPRGSVGSSPHSGHSIDTLLRSYSEHWQTCHRDRVNYLLSGWMNDSGLMIWHCLPWVSFWRLFHKAMIEDEWYDVNEVVYGLVHGLCWEVIDSCPSFSF